MNRQFLRLLANKRVLRRMAGDMEGRQKLEGFVRRYLFERSDYTPAQRKKGDPIIANVQQALADVAPPRGGFWA